MAGGGGSRVKRFAGVKSETVGLGEVGDGQRLSRIGVERIDQRRINR